MKIASKATVANVEFLIRKDQRIAATADQWDRDTGILNTPGGVVELLTGELRQGSPSDHCTKATAVAPGGDCPLWHKFLDRVTAGDKDLQAYLQKIVGYALTGSTREHALFFLYGTGANGKGVFLNTITAILGDYARVAPVDTFTVSTSERHPTDLAMLRGARLVAAQETEEGRFWAEAKIKALTGGDPISARFMRQDFFTFTPQFKLLVAGNHKPRLKNIDEAIRRRLHLIPFAVTIPPEERDDELPEKLRAEWGGILQWAIDGCLLWQADGLTPPAVVQDATREYFGDQDALANWIEEDCELGPEFWAALDHLFQSYKDFVRRSGEMPKTKYRLGQQLESAGFKRIRVPGPERQRGFAGIAIKVKAMARTVWDIFA